MKQIRLYNITNGFFIGVLEIKNENKSLGQEDIKELLKNSLSGTIIVH